MPSPLGVAFGPCLGLTPQIFSEVVILLLEEFCGSFESGEGEVQRAGVCVGVGGAEELAFTSIHPCLVSPHATSRGSSVHI